MQSTLNPNLGLQYLFRAMTVDLSSNTVHNRQVRQRYGGVLPLTYTLYCSYGGCDEQDVDPRGR